LVIIYGFKFLILKDAFFLGLVTMGIEDNFALENPINIGEVPE